MTSSRLITSFNAEVQLDLLFVHSRLQPARGLLVILHLVDAAIRWSAATVCASKEEEELCSKISQIWLAVHGPMEVLVSDEEGGLTGRCATEWADANSINLKPKAPRQEAHMVERHNALLRTIIHHVEEQLEREGIHVPFEQVLSICIFMKNALTVIDGCTPYNALYGRQPALLPPLEGGHIGAIVDLSLIHISEPTRPY